MTQPPDERDPNAPAPTTPPSQPPGGEAPTQAWTPENTTFGASAAPPPEAASTPPPGPTVAWSTPAPAPEVGAPGLTWADTPTRFVAYIIDSFLASFMAGIIASILGVGLAGTSTDPLAATQQGGIFYALVALIGAAYFILSWSGGRRATPGQRLFNIQVGNAFDGRALTTTQAVKRFAGLGGFLGLLAIVPSNAVVGAVNLIQFVWVIVLLVSTVTSPTKQGLHDRFANSAVVRPIGAGSSGATACLIIVIVLFVLFLVSIVALIFLGGQVSAILSAVGESV